MGTIAKNGSPVQLAVPSNVYVRMRETLDDLLATVRMAYQNGIGNEDELRRAERLSIGLSADLGYIEVFPEPPDLLRNSLRYRYQQTENGRPQGPALLVDYRAGAHEIELLRIVAEKPFCDLSGFTDDSLGVLDESLIGAIISEIQKHEEESEDEDMAGYLADRKHDVKVDRIIEDCLDAVRPKGVAHE